MTMNLLCVVVNIEKDKNELLPGLFMSLVSIVFPPLPSIGN